MKALLLAAALALAAHADQLRGIVDDVHDGDTIRLRTPQGMVRVRMQNIDAPELAQAGGHESRDYLRRLAPLGQVVTVEVEGNDKYRRTLGVIWYQNVNLNLSMVRAPVHGARRPRLDLSQILLRPGLSGWGSGRSAGSLGFVAGADGHGPVGVSAPAEAAGRQVGSVGTGLACSCI